MTALAVLLALIVLLWTCVVLAFIRPLAARWREPVLRWPVLILESDDWGSGPLAQSAALARLHDLLAAIRDRTGRPAVMTLGVVMEVPDGGRIADSDPLAYLPLSLADARFGPVRDAMQAGIQTGVFAPQLHGQCHYWPPALIAAARHDAAVREWMTRDEPASTEQLPSALQSRWVDASVLPSRPLSPDVIQQAVMTEAAAYRALFEQPARVAVATTFVWTEAVEAAWGCAGVEVAITPGRRCTCRDHEGQPGCVDAAMLSGDSSLSGLTYLVRDVYFEPHRGHPPQQLVEGLVERTRQGRACLVETHRFNYLDALDDSLGALGAALQRALAACPSVRFLTPLELARAMRERDPDWMETRLRPRLSAWAARLDEIPRFRRASRLSGLAIPLALLGSRA